MLNSHQLRNARKYGEFGRKDGLEPLIIILGILCAIIVVIVAYRAFSEQNKDIVDPPVRAQYRLERIIQVNKDCKPDLSDCTVLHKNWSDQQIVAAIWSAEGGYKAVYPYGIRSVRCETKDDCKRICENTVRNNRIRYSKIKHKGSQSYLAFLQSRYCPDQGRNRSPAEAKLNRNWLRNVTWYLQHPTQTV